jgi:hypothetical protein
MLTSDFVIRPVGQLAQTVRSLLGATASRYDARRAAYDLRKLRGKGLINKIPESRRYTIPPQSILHHSRPGDPSRKSPPPNSGGHVYWQYAGTIASDPAYCEHRKASAASRPVGFVCSLARHFGIALSC